MQIFQGMLNCVIKIYIMIVPQAINSRVITNHLQQKQKEVLIKIIFSNQFQDKKEETLDGTYYKQKESLFIILNIFM